MSFLVKFWGIRGSIPTPGNPTHKFGGNTPCVEIKNDDALFICDAGSGIRELGLDIIQREQPITGHMLFSHAHWDHIQGFPFFMPAYVPNNTFHVYGTSPGDTRFYRLLSGQMNSDYFPVDFHALRAEIQPHHLEHEKTTINGVAVDSFEQNHPGKSFGYTFEKDNLKVVYATDNEIDLEIENKEESLSNPEATRVFPPTLVAPFMNADLLIADGQYTDEEYPQKIGWGHARATSFVDLAIQANVKRLAIFHHDPMHSDEIVEEIIAACNDRMARNSARLAIFGAREGVELIID
jgi:phosphoribosyl 1,2-cyclic phosphodiesterase